MGNPRKPTALKMLHGDRKDRIPEGEPIPHNRKPVPPAWLDAPSLAVWNRYAPDLIAKKVLTAWDEPSFGRYCWLEAQTAILMSELADEGLMRGKVKDPRIQVLRDMNAQLQVLAGRFGLTPSDRAKLGRPKESDDDEGAAAYLS